MSDKTPEPPLPAPDAADPETFASTFREAIRVRGMSLRTVRGRLRDRGYDVSVAALSSWQSGARRPERDTSIDVIRELESLLRLEDGQLLDALGPSRRVGPDRHETFAELWGLDRNPFTAEPEPELFERSGAMGVYIDTESTITRVVNRTLWQARRDGAQQATVFFGLNPSEVTPPQVEGLVGCDLIDVTSDLTQNLVRATLRLHSPLRQGELAFTERQSIGHVATEPEYEFSLIAPRRQSEVLLYVNFDSARLPRRCRVEVESARETTMHSVALNGNLASHAEFNFGPGRLTLLWDW